jgi:uncharacterized protein with ParB-like and HNH nuclease domain
MQSSNLKLGQILKSPAQSQYAIPVFQRHYSWDTPQWEKLWEDIARAVEEGKLWHFMGFLVVVPDQPQPGQPLVYYVIDGQQRLTTLSLLLIALRNLAKVEGEVEIAKEIDSFYLIHSDEKSNLRYRLLPRGQDQSHYLELIDEKKRTDNSMHRAVEFFSNKLKELLDESGLSVLSDFKNTIVQRLEFICATVEKSDNPYNIFKSLNATGLALSPADLIRNFMFMHVPAGQQDHFYHEHWVTLEKHFYDVKEKLNTQQFTDFLRDYLMSEGTYIAPKALFATFEDTYAGQEFNPSKLVDKLIERANDYLLILGHKHHTSADIEKALDALRSIKNSTINPLLLKLLNLNKRGYLNNTSTAQALDVIVSFIVRRFVCGEPSKSYNKLFVMACKSVSSDGNISGLEEYLYNHGFPDTERFVTAFINLQLYGSSYARFVLVELERSFGHKEMASLSKAQIEHIMPQTLTPKWCEELGVDCERVHSTWLHTPGNLTLSAYNPELSNRPFQEKRVEYQKSNIVLTKELCAAESWDEEQIRSRGEQLGRQAAELWPLPVVMQSNSQKQKHIQFWGSFWEYLAENKSFLYSSRRKLTLDKHWLWFKVGRNNIFLNPWVDLRLGQIGVDITMQGAGYKEHFEKLMEHRTTIEREIAEELQWLRNESPSRCVVRFTTNIDLQETLKWEESFDWLQRYSQSFHSAFKPHISAL